MAVSMIDITQSLTDMLQVTATSLTMLRWSVHFNLMMAELARAILCHPDHLSSSLSILNRCKCKPLTWVILLAWSTGHSRTWIIFVKHFIHALSVLFSDDPCPDLNLTFWPLGTSPGNGQLTPWRFNHDKGACMEWNKHRWRIQNLIRCMELKGVEGTTNIHRALFLKWLL